MPKYKLIAGTHSRKEGKKFVLYRPGDEIEFTEEQAERFGFARLDPLDAPEAPAIAQPSEGEPKAVAVPGAILSPEGGDKAPAQPPSGPAKPEGATAAPVAPQAAPVAPVPAPTQPPAPAWGTPAPVSGAAKPPVKSRPVAKK